MKRILFIICLSIFNLSTSTAIAADKVVVIPLGGDKHYLYWQGEWNADNSYKVGDGVQYEGSSYICLQTHTSTLSSSPPTTTYWDLLAAKGATQKGSIFRWQVFSTYLNGETWVMSNSAELHGGYRPSHWTDGKGTAENMSNDAEVLRTLLTRKGYGGTNAMVHSEVYHQYSSTNGRVIIALFRIKNTTDSTIDWTPYFYHTCNSAWGELASIAINGTNTWDSGSSNCTPSSNANTTVSIPSDQTSTVIVVSASSNGMALTGGMYVRYVNLTFNNDSLALPSGLEYVDDLDSVEGTLW